MLACGAMESPMTVPGIECGIHWMLAAPGTDGMVARLTAKPPCDSLGTQQAAPGCGPAAPSAGQAGGASWLLQKVSLAAT